MTYKKSQNITKGL